MKKHNCMAAVYACALLVSVCLGCDAGTDGGLLPDEGVEGGSESVIVLVDDTDTLGDLPVDNDPPDDDFLEDDPPADDPPTDDPPADDPPADDPPTDDPPADDPPVDDPPADDPPVLETCPEGVICVDSLPYTDWKDTSAISGSLFDVYPCKPTADESGPEYIYQITVPEAGLLSVAVYDQEGVDIDVHILEELDVETCISRGHHEANADVDPGIYYIVADTYVSGGVEQSGFYQLEIGLTLPSAGPCLMETGIMKRVGDGGDHLEMPATGPVVMEAHLVTQEEEEPYPTHSTEKLLEHYLLSQSATGYVMYRDQNWAPLEGGSFYGAGIGSPTAFPVIDEHWYVCMYWTSESRPAKGTKMIMRLPGTNRAVVVAAGYETGPGNLDNIGGTCEETHHYLGTGHKDILTLGIATDQSLPFGPRLCDE